MTLKIYYSYFSTVVNAAQVTNTATDATLLPYMNREFKFVFNMRTGKAMVKCSSNKFSFEQFKKSFSIHRVESFPVVARPVVNPCVPELPKAIDRSKIFFAAVVLRKRFKNS
ncbi:Uncharacterised protein r2_g1206 [Pycnogonum litorale]